MSEKKDIEDCPSEEASGQEESYDANKCGTSETYDMKDFCPGIRIEAKDFDGKWYPAKVSDVDWTENEILVHFENWNTKFDEWIPMDSSRLRPLQKPILQQKDHVKFSKGEEVMAMWSPYQKYPATIQAVLANDRYDVLFYDGFLKRLKSHKISKLEGGSVKSEVRNFTDIGTKEERRERKRKINVAELFHVNKRSKKKGLVHSKSQDIKTYPVSRSRNKCVMVKKGIASEENSEKIASAESNETKHKDDKLPNSGTSVSSKALIDTIPAAFEVKYINGQTEMWSKQLYQRSEGRTAGKLDIVILNPQGRKFRSRNEIMKFCEENGIIYSHEAFDFSAKGRPKSKSNLQTPTTKVEANVEDKEKLLLKKGQKKSQLDAPVAASQSLQAINPAEILPFDNNDQSKVFIGDFEVVIENGKFICPVKTCGKHFRRENLLHMHMKYYHPEFSKYLDSTPSVTDLAYARTVGGLDGAEVSSPAPRKLIEKPEKPSGKVENVRKSNDASLEYPKETKKLKTSETKPESKTHLVKGPNELTSSDVGEKSIEESQKNKSSVNILPVKNASNSNDFGLIKSESSVASEKNGSVTESKSTEQAATEAKSASSSHTAIKSLKHKLNGRKKANRFQGSFSEHLRKKRLISQENSRSQSRAGRQQQSQHPRQQSQEVAPLQATAPSQSSNEDANPNASSHAQPVARYPKPHSNLMNELSGKNNLLTSSKSISPSSEKSNRERRHGFEGADDKNLETRGNGPLTNGEGQTSENSRRSFIAGLINARKRRAKTSYRLRKKRRKESREVQQSAECCPKSDFSKPTELSRDVEKPDAQESINGNYLNSEFFNLINSNDCGQANWRIAEGKCEKNTITQRKKLRLRLRRIDDELKSVENVFQVSKRGGCKESSEEKNVSKESPSGNDLNLKWERESLRTENSVAVRKDDFGGSTEGLKDLGKSKEKAEGPKGVPEKEKEIKSDFVYGNDSPKNYVLLENVCRKEIQGKPVNVSRRGNDENLRSNSNGEMEMTVSARQKVSRKGAGRKFRGGKFTGKKSESGQMSTKRVRFEKAVMEKLTDSEEVEEECVDHRAEAEESKRVMNGSGERRKEDRKKRLSKSQSIDNRSIGKEINQDDGDDDNDSDGDDGNHSRCDNSLLRVNSGLDQTEGTEDSKSNPVAVENNKVEKLRRNEIINCVCGITEEDGLMIQCDLCLCWQHGHCADIFRESDVPDKYTCAICKNPYRARSSMKYLHDQEWLKEGTLPSLSFRSKREDVINQRRTILKRSYDLSGSIALLARVIHSLRLKVNIAEKKDHPKLWLWAKKWTEKKLNRLKDESDLKEEKVEQSINLSNGVKKEEGLTEDEKQLPKAPEPEAPIDSAECKLNLLDHLIHYQTLIDARLSCIESLVAELESMQDDAVNDETPDHFPRTKATVQMLLRDLNTMRKIAII